MGCRPDVDEDAHHAALRCWRPHHNQLPLQWLLGRQAYGRDGGQCHRMRAGLHRRQQRECWFVQDLPVRRRSQCAAYGYEVFLYSEHPTADNTNPNAGVSSQGLSRFTCWQPADTTVSTHAPTNACTMSTLAQNNFDNRGDTSLSTSTAYQYTCRPDTPASLVAGHIRATTTRDSFATRPAMDKRRSPAWWQVKTTSGGSISTPAPISGPTRIRLLSTG